MAVNARIGEGALLSKQASLHSGAQVGYRSAVDFLGTILQDTVVGEEATVGAHSRIGKSSNVGSRGCIVNSAKIGEGYRVLPPPTCARSCLAPCASRSKVRWSVLAPVLGPARSGALKIDAD